MEARKILAANVKRLMQHTGIQSQSQLAGMAGISQAQVGKILNEKTGVSIDILQRLAEALECETWILLAPVRFLKDVSHLEFIPLLHWYMRLGPSAQDAIWKITHELFVASGNKRSS